MSDFNGQNGLQQRGGAPTNGGFPQPGYQPQPQQQAPRYQQAPQPQQYSQPQYPAPQPQPGYQQPAPAPQQAPQGGSELLTGGAKAMYVILGALIPFVGAIVLVNSGRNYPEGRFREAAKWFAIGCIIAIVLSLLGGFSSVGDLSSAGSYSGYGY